MIDEILHSADADLQPLSANVPAHIAAKDAALLAAARGLDQAPAAAANQQQADGTLQAAAPGPDPHDYQLEATQLIGFAHIGLAPYFPHVALVYDAEVCGRLAAAVAPLMEKYGVTLGSMFERYHLELGLLMVVIPLIAPTAAAIAADRAQREKASSSSPAPAIDLHNMQTAVVDQASPLAPFAGINRPDPVPARA